MALLRGLPGPRGLRSALIVRRARRSWPRCPGARRSRDAAGAAAASRRGRDRRPVLPQGRQRRLRRRRTTGCDIAYTPKTRCCKGVATITAKATQDLSSFNLDFRGLKVRSAEVGGRAAKWRREGAELTIVPRASLRRGRPFTAVIAYDGKPRPGREGSLGDEDGFMPTDDGALVAGEPHSAVDVVPGQRAPARQGELLVPHQRPARAGGDRQRRSCSASSTAAGGRSGAGRRRSRWRLPLDGDDRAVRHLHAGPSTGSRTWTRSTPTCSSAQAAHRRALRRDRRSRSPAISGCCARSTSRRAARSSPSGSTTTRSRSATSSSSRPTPPARTTGRRCATSAATPSTSDVRLPRRAQAAPVPRALPARRRGRGCQPKGTTGRWQAASFPDQRLRALGRRPLALRGPQRRGRADLRDRRRLPVQRRRRRRHRRHGRGRLDLVRGRRRHARRLDRPGRTAPAARRTRPTGPRPRSPQGPRAAGDVAQAAVAREPEMHRLPRERLRAVSVLDGRRRSSTTR